MEENKTVKYAEVNPSDQALVFESLRWMMNGRFGNRRQGGKYNMYAERLLACLSFAARTTIAGSELDGKVFVRMSDKFIGYREVSVSLLALLNEDDLSNHSYAVKSVKKLQSCVMEVSEGDNTKLRSIIVEADVLKGECRVKFFVSPEVWEALTDYKGGYRVTEYWVARVLRSFRSYRMYKLVCGQAEGCVYRLDNLMAYLDIPEFYASEVSKLKSQYLNPIVKELNATSPWSCEFVFDIPDNNDRKQNHRGRKTIKYVLVKPVHIPKNERNVSHVMKDVSGYKIESLIDARFVKRLVDRYHFSSREINNNKELFLFANEVMKDDLYKFIIDKTEYYDSVAVKNRKGYIIGSIRKQLLDMYGVVAPDSARSKKASRRLSS